LITSLVETLHGMYRFRMSWTKIVNAPWWFAALWRGIKRVVPSETSRKVEILSTDFKSLQALFAPGQLEQRYGGSAPNLEAAADFPCRFYPGPYAKDGKGIDSASMALHDASTQATDLARLHQITGSEAHEGRLWVKGDEDSWLPFVQNSIITVSAADYLKKEFSVSVAPCESWPSLREHLSTRSEFWRAESSEEADDDNTSSSTMQVLPNAACTSNGSTTNPTSPEESLAGDKQEADVKACDLNHTSHNPKVVAAHDDANVVEADDADPQCTIPVHTIDLVETEDVRPAAWCGMFHCRCA
jgi:hypothetical protein